METISLETIKKQYDDDKTPEIPSMSLQLKYTLLVNNRNKKYPQVYTGFCCEKRIKDFVRHEDNRCCRCIIF